VCQPNPQVLSESFADITIYGVDDAFSVTDKEMWISKGQNG
jgi:hypothetical protein